MSRPVPASNRPRSGLNDPRSTGGAAKLRLPDVLGLRGTKPSNAGL